MGEIPQEQASQRYRTLARFVGTTQGERTLVRPFFQSHWYGWMSMCLLIVVILVICPITGGAFVLDLGLMNEQVLTEPRRTTLTSERASASRVGSIMAFLATLEEASVLPPEGTPQANQVIHALIQFQSALKKSVSPELAAYRVAAEAFVMTQHTEEEDAVAEGQALTSRVLGAFIAYDQEHPLWDNPKRALAMQKFNVTHVDWMLIVDLFHQAEAVFREQGRSIHQIYETWRTTMPGGKS